jgi:hypothetical protein
MGRLSATAHKIMELQIALYVVLSPISTMQHLADLFTVRGIIKSYPISTNPATRPSTATSESYSKVNNIFSSSR